MFYFLILLGSGLILFGRYTRKRQSEGPESVPQAAKLTMQEASSGQTGVEALSIRMDQIEKLVFQGLMVQAGRKEGFRAAGGETDAQTSEETSEPEAEALLAGTEDSAGAEDSAEAEDPAGVGHHALEGTGPSLRTGPASEEAIPGLAVETLEEKPETSPKKRPMPDNIQAIVDYENQGLSVQEIVNVTRMNKGEVLLLKNLSKHYTK